MTLHSAVAAVGLAFIYIVFVAGLCVVLDIAPFPKGVLLGIDNQCFGGSIHVESPTGGRFLSYAVGRGLSGIQVVVISGERVEDIGRVFAIVVLGFERVALDHQQSVLIVCGDLSRFPCEQVVVYVSPPLRHDFGGAAIEHPITVEHGYDRIVRGVGASAYIDYCQIAIPHFAFFGGIFPYFQRPFGSGLQFDFLQGLFPGGFFAVNVAFEPRRTTAATQLFHQRGIEHSFARVAECLYIIAGIFGHHVGMPGILFPFLPIPSDCFERGSPVP